MYTTVRNKKRSSLFALVGLFVILSMLITPVAEVKALSNAGNNDPLVKASGDLAYPIDDETEGDPADPSASQNGSDAGKSDDGEDKPQPPSSGTPTEDPALADVKHPKGSGGEQATPQGDQAKSPPSGQDGGDPSQGEGDGIQTPKGTEDTEAPSDEDRKETPSPEGTEETKQPATEGTDETQAPTAEDGEETPAPEGAEEPGLEGTEESATPEGDEGDGEPTGTLIPEDGEDSTPTPTSDLLPALEADGEGVRSLEAGMTESNNERMFGWRPSCPEGNGWVKVNNLSSTSYLYDAPTGKEVVKVCYVAGYTKRSYHVNPPASQVTVTSNVKFFGHLLDLHHASFKLVDVVDPNAIDLSVSLTDLTATCNEVSATVEVHNSHSTNEASGVTVNLDVTGGAGYLADSTSQSHTFGSIAAGGTVSKTFTFSTNTSWITATGESVSFTAAITSAGQSDPDPSNNAASSSVTNPGDCAPDLAISTELTSESRCGDLTFTVSLINSGKSVATNVSVLNTIVHGSGYVASISPASLEFGDISAGETESQEVTIQVNDNWLAASSHAKIKVKATIDNEDIFPAQNEGRSNELTIKNPGNCMPRLTVDVQIDKTNPCGDLPFTVTVENHGQLPATNVEVKNSDVYDGLFLDYVESISPSTFNFGDIAGGESVSLSGTIHTTQQWINTWSLGIITIEAKVTNEDTYPAGNIGAFDHAAIKNPGNCALKPQVASECVVHEGVLKHQLTITNPNTAYSIYVRVNGTGGFKEIGSGDSRTFYTDFKAQNATIEYKKGNYDPNRCGGCGAVFSFTVSLESCLLAPSLSAECGTSEENVYGHNWTVSNPNPVPLDYAWTGTNTDPASGSGTIGANDSAEFFTPENGSSQSVTLTYTYQDESQTLAAVEDAACELAKSSVDPSPTCSWSEETGSLITLTFALDGVASLTFDGTAYDSASPGWDEDDQTLTITDLIPGTYDYAWTGAPGYLGGAVEDYELLGCETPAVTFSLSCSWDKQNKVSVNQITVNFDPNKIDTLKYNFTGNSGDNILYTGPITVTNDGTLYVQWEGKPGYTAGEDQYTYQTTTCQPLNLTFECGYPSDTEYIWRVTNNNGYPVDYTWQVYGSSESGSGTVAANDVARFTTTTGSKTVKLFVDGKLHSTKASGNPCKVDLELSYACLENGDHQWTVTNDNDFDQPISWLSTTGEDGTTTVSKKGTATFTTGPASQSVTITYQHGIHPEKTVTTDAEACVLEPLVLYACREFDNSHIWTIKNPNPFAINVQWKLDEGDYGDWVAIAAGATIILDPTTSGEQTITVQYRYGEETIATMEPITAEVCKLSGLTIDFLCGYPSDQALFWRVTNPFDFPVDFVIASDGNEAGEEETVPANGDIIIQTALGVQTAVIYVNGNEADRADSGETCLLDLSLDYQCLENGNHQWTVTNNNKNDLLFNWYLDNVLGGSAIDIKAGGSVSFTTGKNAQTVRVEHVDEIFGAKVTETEAEACKITTTTPEPPTLVIPQLTTGTCQPWIVFHTYRDGNLELYRLDGIENVGDFSLINLSKHGSHDIHPSRSFDDAWVAFQSFRDGNHEIYITDSSGKGQIRLTDNAAQDINPMFSPDNVHIVFQSNRNGNWDLYLVNRLTGEETQLTDHSADETYPFFSMDRNWLAFESNRNGNRDIFLLNLATGEETQVTDGGEDEIRPAWSPDGQKIAYLAPVDGIWQLFVSDIDGENAVQITDGDGDTKNHAWSPDSARLAYQSERDGNVDIYAYDLREDQEYRVTDYADEDTSPTWDCGGTNLAFTSKGDSSSTDIYMSHWQGGGSTRMTDHPSTDKWSEWSPAMEFGSRGK